MWKTKMKAAGFPNWTSDSSAADNRCRNTKKLVVVGHTRPKAAKKDKYLVAQYIKKKWELQFKTETDLDKICKTGARGKAIISPPTIKDIRDLLINDTTLKSSKNTVLYSKTVGLKIMD